VTERGPAAGDDRSGGETDDSDPDPDLDPDADRRSSPVLAPLWAALDRWGLAATAALTALIVGVVFYFPVVLVLRRAVVDGGRFTLAPIVAVVTDPFYVGVLADVIRNPLAIGRHLGAVVGFVAEIRLRPGTYDILGVDLPWLFLVVPGVRTGLFGFTAYQALLSTLLSVAVGIPGAYVLSNYEFRGRRFLRSVTILPFVLPAVMVAIGFYAMFGAQGTFNRALSLVGLGGVELLFTLKIVVIAHAFYNAPLVIRVTTAAWESVDRRTVETARSLGASPRRAFADVVVPQLLPAILTGALLTFIFTFLTFPIVLMLGGARLATVEVWVYRRIRQLAYGEAAALAVVETALSLGLTLAYLRYERRAAALGTGSVETREPLVPSLRALATPRRLAILGYGAVVVVLFAGPLASMILASVTNEGALTLRWYRVLVERQVEGASFQTKPVPAVRNSILFAGATLAVAVPMGVVVAVTTRRWRGGDLLETLAMAPLAVSGIIVGIGLLEGLVFGVDLPGPYRLVLTGPVAVVAAHAVAAYPFVVRSVGPLLSRIDRATVESARALGASRARTLLDVELPLVASGVVAGAAFAVAISIGEFDSTVLLAEGGTTYTMPVAVERYLGSRTLGPASAMGTIMLAVTAAAFVVVDRVGGRFER
jgi:thiamine transport system permease protein